MYWNFQNLILWSCSRGLQAESSNKRKKIRWEMEHCHHWKFRLFNFMQFWKLQVLGDLDQDVMLHLSYKFGWWIEGVHVNHVKKIVRMKGQKLTIQEKSRKKYWFHPFWDKPKSWTIWDYDHKWHSIIWFSFCLQNDENNGQQNFSQLSHPCCTT
jgi:hypothetical protein